MQRSLESDCHWARANRSRAFGAERLWAERIAAIFRPNIFLPIAPTRDTPMINRGPATGNPHQRFGSGILNVFSLRGAGSGLTDTLRGNPKYASPVIASTLAVT